MHFIITRISQSPNWKLHTFLIATNNFVTYIQFHRWSLSIRWNPWHGKLDTFVRTRVRARFMCAWLLSMPRRDVPGGIFMAKKSFITYAATSCRAHWLSHQADWENRNCVFIDVLKSPWVSLARKMLGQIQCREQFEKIKKHGQHRSSNFAP